MKVSEWQPEEPFVCDTLPVTWGMVGGRRHYLALCRNSSCEQAGVARACKHVMLFLKGRWELFHGPLPEQCMIDVPLFRKGVAYPDVEVVLQVSVGPANEYDNKIVTLAEPSYAEKEVIDTLSPSSGVWAIRNSILQWAFSMYKEVPDCSNPTHRRTWAFAKGSVRMHDAATEPILADIVCLYSFGKCARCLLSKNQVSLVPDI